MCAWASVTHSGRLNLQAELGESRRDRAMPRSVSSFSHAFAHGLALLESWRQDCVKHIIILFF
jgi:hypothetical protein